MNYWQRLERLAMHSEQEIGEILNYICLETVFWTLRYIQLFVQNLEIERKYCRIILKTNSKLEIAKAFGYSI